MRAAVLVLTLEGPRLKRSIATPLTTQMTICSCAAGRKSNHADAATLQLSNDDVLLRNGWKERAGCCGDIAAFG